MAPAITPSLAWPSVQSISINRSDISGIDFTGSQQPTRSVRLTWQASTSNVVGYNIHRSTTKGGAYVKINATLVAPLTYTDSRVASSTTYYYVATSVDPTGIESLYSIQASASIP